jgi:hypothetical protein
VVALTNVDWSELFGVPTRRVDDSLNPLAMLIGSATILGWFSLGGLYYLWKRNSDVVKKLGPLRYAIVAGLFLIMTALPIKILLRLTLNVKYILVTPWFNI